jgi:hypothetical protein
MKDLKDSFRVDTFDVNSQLNIVNVTQIDKDSILICHDNLVKIIGMDGIVKQEVNKRTILEFNFKIESLVCLPDQESVIAFHKHGLEERSFKEDDVKFIYFIFTLTNMLLYCIILDYTRIK